MREDRDGEVGSGARPGLHHLALGAGNVEGLAAFYHEVFGLPVVARHLHEDGGLRSIWLGLGDGAVLMIEEAEEPASAQHPGDGSSGDQGGRRRGLFLLALRISLEQRAVVDEALGSPEEETEFTSYYRDPEGNRIAISGYEF